ncbi:MAG TPA: hypothetical protein VLU92_03315 [Candidatus Dormibacteraeota bacterium]|nr:hypothetical protein [Candidatus Dormibacteraeota bacterium]
MPIAVQVRPGTASSIRAAWGIVTLLAFAACAPFGACGETTKTGAPSPSVTLTASASLTFTPSSVDFRDQLRGPGSSGIIVVVHIANSGTGPPVALGSLSVQPAGYVTISKDGCSNQTLAPGATCSIELGYPATNAPAGTFAGTLVVPDDIPPDRESRLSLKGNLEQM